jgi:arginyl-tRNA synthetase
MRVQPFLEQLCSAAVATACGTPAPGLVRSADPAHGDYQVNGALPLAKQLGKPPRSLAEPIAAELRKHPAIASAEVAGPGFINLRLSPSFVSEQLLAVAGDLERDGVDPVAQPQRVVVDFSSPNIAKEMHVGHIRSTILGDALSRTLAFIGHHVTRDNHVGDWGTQFGLLIVGMRRHGDEAALAAEPVQELERVYKLASADAKADPSVGDEARAELAKLQRGDAENRALWERFVAASRTELDRVYARLDITFDLWRGESAYEDMLPGVVEQLLASGVARRDQGAVCVFFEDDAELGKSETPFIIQKQDGAFLYGTTDIATVLWRKAELGTERAIYVVDNRQSLHFRYLFATVKKLGVAMQLEHVAFGTILSGDGKPLQTRQGGTIKLAALLDEAEERAATLMRAEGIEASPELARAVGVGAVKYADLCQNRTSDYRFDWDKLISLKGNAGPYLQMAHARIAGIFRKGEIAPSTLVSAAPITLEHAAELLLAKRILGFADAVHQTADTCQPHVLCEHLHALARDFSVFYEACPVLKAEGEQRRSRLLLSWLTARQLKRGLALLGIGAPERM